MRSEIRRRFRKALHRLLPREHVVVLADLIPEWLLAELRVVGRLTIVSGAPDVSSDEQADPRAFSPTDRPDTVLCVGSSPEAVTELTRNAGSFVADGGLVLLLLQPGADHETPTGVQALTRAVTQLGMALLHVATSHSGDVLVVASTSERDLGLDEITLYVVTATLNGLSHTKALEYALRESNAMLRIVFVDNGSTDGTREWLQSIHALDQICIINELNVGVAAAWNMGIRVALANDADAILICGNDTLPYPGTIERLLQHVKNGCAFVTGTGRRYDVAQVPVGLPVHDTLLTDSALDFAMFIMSAHAVRALMRGEQADGRQTLPEDAGLFDARFFPAYFEDTDYIMRLDRAGIPAFRDPGALFGHEVALTTKMNQRVGRTVSEAFQDNEQLFRSKWGFSPLDAIPAADMNDRTLRMWKRLAGEDGATVAAFDAAQESSSSIGGVVGRALLARGAPPANATAAPIAYEASGSSTADKPGLRILWASNAPWVPSGYGVQTKLFAPRLRELGHDVAVHCIFGLEGGRINWEGIPMYPGGGHPGGQDTLARHYHDFEADLAIFLCDAWIADHRLLGHSVRFVPWFPVDSDPMPRAVADRVRRSWRSIVFSRFGERKAVEAGLSVDYVPHGVDTKTFSPADKRAARTRLGVPQDAFVIGMVAMNKEDPSRKAFPQVLQAFAEFRRKHSDALLYLFTQPRGCGGLGVDIPRIASAVGVDKFVRFPEEGVLDTGASDAEMCELYNCFDVLAAPSLGEGFCVPIVEAQACGLPVIVGAGTAMPELCFAGVALDAKECDRQWTSLESWQLAPRVGAIVEAFEHIRAHLGEPTLSVATARTGALSYDSSLVLREYWQPLLEGYAAEISRCPRNRARERRLTRPVAQVG